MGNIELVQKCAEPSRLCEYNSCKSAHQILAPGNSKNNSTPASRPSYGKYGTRAKSAPNQQGYVNTGWCKSVQLNTHARKRLTECHSKLTEKKDHRTEDRTGEHQGCRHNLNSCPRGPISPNLRSIRVSIQPYEDIRPPDQG